MEHVIRTQGLGKSYVQVKAVSDVNLEVPPHSIFGFLGPNGAGKTTTMKMLLGLGGKGDRPARGFSGGERQRLGIAEACIHDPDLLILDEPAASLDPMGRRDVLEILQRLQERATVVYSTHILDDVEPVSDRVAILRDGELVKGGRS